MPPVMQRPSQMIDPAKHPYIAKLVSLLGGEGQIPMPTSIMGSIAPRAALGAIGEAPTAIPIHQAAPDSLEYLTDVVRNTIPRTASATKALGGVVKQDVAGGALTQMVPPPAAHHVAEDSELMKLVNTLAGYYYGHGGPR